MCLSGYSFTIYGPAGTKLGREVRVSRGWLSVHYMNLCVTALAVLRSYTTLSVWRGESVWEPHWQWASYANMIAVFGETTVNPLHANVSITLAISWMLYLLGSLHLQVQKESILQLLTAVKILETTHIFLLLIPLQPEMKLKMGRYPPIPSPILEISLNNLLKSWHSFTE